MIDHAYAPPDEPSPGWDWQKDQGRRQRERILAVWRERAREAQPSPTVREVCAEIGLSSSSTAQNHVNILLAEGRLVQHRACGGGLRTSGGSRTILLPPGWWRADGVSERCDGCGRR